MSISAAAILAFVISKHDADTPGLSDKVRDRLEWTWGLRHNHLDEHLQEFNDPQMSKILLDNSLLVMPRSESIHEMSGCDLANLTLKFDVRRPHIKRLYKGCTSFEYVVVPIAPDNPLLPRMLVSEVPPHLVMCITAGKLLKTWEHLAGEEYTAVGLHSSSV
ncbi:hypothetical protein B0H13DRAFT_438537 [Mycena leptocephala]|nr:hypothetical protein B0H13DRAFT_438537 [Mycena leptocephala]